jgi:cytochrome c biogenesis protein CcmG/thiol:disulfide interchange protein DsbE
MERIEPRPQRRPWRLGLFLLPLGLFTLLGIVLGLGLTRDPSQLPSTLLDKPLPSLQLAPIAGRDLAGLDTATLRGEPMLLNVFASWCVPCRVEAPVLEELAKEGVVIHGINYKDAPDRALQFLRDFGDPFRGIGADPQGRGAIELGVYGVPETFVLDGEGRVAYKFVGPLQPRDVERTLLPLLEKLRR